MENNESMETNLGEKYEFFNKYDAVPKVIKTHLNCYAIASDWWLTFQYFLDIAREEEDMPMGNPGPINNIPILYHSDLDDYYKQLIIPKSNTQPINYSVLPELNDWDRMSLKRRLEYKTDFVIVSFQLWRFLKNKYGGGPEIELIPESKKDQIDTPSSLLITSDQESSLDKNVVVSLDLIKVQVVKEGDTGTRTTKCVSKTLTFNNLLVCLSTKFCFPLQNSSISYLNKGTKLMEIKEKHLTLFQVGVQEGAIVSVSQKGEHNLIESTPIRPKPMTEVHLRFNQDDESSKTDDNNSGTRDRDTVVRQVFDDSDYGDNNYTNHSREGSDKISTEGTSNPRRNSFSFDNDPIFGDGKIYIEGSHVVDEFGGMNSEWRGEIIPMTGSILYEIEKFLEKHPDLSTFLEKAKQGLGKEKLFLNFKSLKEIKSNMKNLQHEWSLRSSSIFSKKI